MGRPADRGDPPERTPSTGSPTDLMISGIGSHSRVYVFLLGVVAVAAAGLAWFFENTSLGLAAAILGLYVLHLYSMQVMQRQWRALQGLERLVGELGLEEEPAGEQEGEIGGGTGASDREAGAAASTAGEERTVHRDFGLGTVAIIKGMMSPRDVSEVMAEHRRRPGLTFGDHAVELGHLTETELEDLVQVKHRGVYEPGEIRQARRRIREYRSSLDPEMTGA